MPNPARLRIRLLCCPALLACARLCYLCYQPRAISSRSAGREFGMTIRRCVGALAIIGFGFVFGVQAQAGPTFDKVKQAGQIACGVNTGLAGFAQPDNQGRYTGLDVDICTAVVFYDGQGFMVPKKLGVKSAKELGGATICVQPGTTTELNLADYFRANKMQFKPVVIEKLDEVENAFFSGRCDAYTTDRSGLAATRAAKAPNPDDYVILPEVISKEPLAPAVRHGDDEWFDVVKWTVFAMIQAEEKGITSQNVDAMLKSDDPEVQRMLGVSPGMGKALHLDEKWAYNIIKQVGNYGEVFERNVGSKTPLKLDRGINALWTKGGLMYAMPFR